MLCEVAGPLGIPVVILDSEGAPAKQALHHPHHITGSFKDPDMIRALARKSDVLTVEIEHVDANVLDEIATKGVEVDEINDKGQTVKVLRKVPVHPAPSTLKLIQDKYLQKEHLKAHGIPISEQVVVAPGGSVYELTQSMLDAGSKLGYPFMLKARQGSYDGRGNYVVKSAHGVADAAKEMDGFSLYAEKWVPFKMELSAMVLRLEDDKGDKVSTTPFPCVETVHEESICSRTYMPPRNAGEAVQLAAREMACQVVLTLRGRGVFAVEMFLLDDGA